MTATGPKPTPDKTDSLATNTDNQPAPDLRPHRDGATDQETDRAGATGYHDSLTGQPVSADGEFINEPGRRVQDKSHIVADNWPELRQ